MPKSETKAAATAPPSPSVAWTWRPSPKNKTSKAKRMPITSGKPRITENDESKLVESSKYPNVSLNRTTGRWQAWTGPWTKWMATTWVGRGPYVGEFATEYLAARGKDRSLLKHREMGTKLPIELLNFAEADYASDEKLRNALTNEEFHDLLSRESRPCYKKVEPTKCMQTFMAEEARRGNLPVKSKGKATYKVMPLRDYLIDAFMKRPDDVADAPAEMLKKQKAVTKAVDDLLRDDDPEIEEMDVEEPFPAPKTEKMDDATEAETMDDDVIKTEKMDVEDPIQAEVLDISNLLMLADVALAHPDLKPYEV